MTKYAFPLKDRQFSDENGMDLRDYFAAKAMAALISSPHINLLDVDSRIAQCAYNMADEMLKERSLR